ncbi:MAG: beta strand repeat-containing protein, partial [Gemmatimonadales bacterium]
SDSVTTVIAPPDTIGVLSGTTTVATVGGIATFSNVILTGVGNGYVLMSGANGFQPVFSSAINIDIQIPLGINAVWRGTVDSLWTNAANWTSGILPDSASNVFIPAGMPHLPYLGISGFVHVNRLVIAAGAGFKADTFSTVQVDSSLDNSANVTGGGTVELAGAGTVRGLFNNVTVAGNYAVATGSLLQANGYLTISGPTGRLDLNGTNSSTNGDLTVTNGGLLVMTGASDTLNVTGSASFNGGNELGFLTAGRILLQGNFAQYASSQLGATPTAFAATAGHVTELLRGSGIQTVHFANPDTTGSHFGSLVLSGADSVVFDTLAIALGNVSVTGANTAVQSHDTLAVAGSVSTVTGSRLWLTGLGVAGALNVAGAYHVGTTGFVGVGQTVPALAYDSIQVIGTAVLGANTTAGRFILGGQPSGAQFDLNGHTLTVTGNFVVDTTGKLVMTSATDTIAVAGNFSTDGTDTYGSLTNGLIDIGGNFVQAAGPSPASFAATGAHTVRFLSGQHSWGFAAPDTGAAGSHFANLTVLSGGVVRDTALGGTVIAGDLTLTGATLVDSMTHLVGEGTVPYPVKVLGNVGADAASVFGLLELDVAGTITASMPPAQYGVATTVFSGLGQTIPALGYQSLMVTGSASAGADLTVLNDLTIQDDSATYGTFAPAGHTITVLGTLTTYDHGTLVMTQTADSVDVGSGPALGGANFAGGNEAGKLTAGTLVIDGEFQQTARPLSLVPINDSAFFATGTHRTVFTGTQQGYITYATPALQFNKLDIIGSGGAQLSRGATVPFVVADSFQIRQTSYLYDNGQERVVALGPVVADTQAWLSLDTLEVHSTLSVPLDTNFYVTTTRFAGTNQAIPS